MNARQRLAIALTTLLVGVMMGSIWFFLAGVESAAMAAALQAGESRGESLEPLAITVVYTVTNENDSGPGSLRYAINWANGQGTNVKHIKFNISDCTGICEVRPLTCLPALTGDKITIDGNTQPGSSVATESSPATIAVIVDGADSTNCNGFNVTSEANIIRGINIANFDYAGISIYGASAKSNRVTGNHIGTYASGGGSCPNLTGVSILNGASYNDIGDDTPAERNVISGNTWHGVTIGNSGSVSNTVSGNYIGLDAGGDNDNENGWDGVFIGEGADYNLVGGDSPGERNLISGNGIDGVGIHGAGTTHNTVSGNYIGMGQDGAWCGGCANNWNGVSIYGGAQYNLVGGDSAGERNLIGGNSKNGVRLEGGQTMSNTVSGNYIGMAMDGVDSLSNYMHGVFITSGANHNLIGGDSAGEGNLISGNNQDGVHLEGVTTTYNTVSGNFIGLTASGEYSTTWNVRGGVALVDGASHNLIGGDAPGERNLISNNQRHGVRISGAETHANQVSGNYIGLDSTGAAGIGNSSSGVCLDQGAHDNQIGGSGAGQGNVISDNYWAGVVITGSATMDNILMGNYIGTDASGMSAIGNGVGIDLRDGANQNLIGGTDPGKGNLISGNNNEGVYITGAGVSENVFEGNLIGLLADQSGGLPNIGHGMYICNGARNNRVGPENVIAYNGQSGVTVNGAATYGVTITQNSIYSNTYGSISVSGGNYNIQRPEILEVHQESRAVEGDACPGCTVELFASPTANRDGRVFLDDTVTDFEGHFTVNYTSLPYFYLTATATDVVSGTSRLSEAIDGSIPIFLPLVRR